jgi:hypothetical protein
VQPQARLDRVTLLFDNALVVANPDASVAAQVPARLAAGEPAETLLGSSTTVIPLQAISKIRSNKNGSDMNVHYTAQGKSRMSNIGFADAATRDEVFAAVQQRLGQNVRVQVQELNSLQAGIKPGLVLVVATFFVIAGYAGALEIAAGTTYDVHGRGAMLQRAYISLVSLLGPTGVVILGGLLLLMLLIWFVKRVGTPPTYMTLTRTN